MNNGMLKGSFANSRAKILAISGVYVWFSLIFATTTLDVDEFTFLKEPYEMLGGDYTIGYLKEDNYKKAAKTIAKSYFFYWYYRPLFSPIISEKHKYLFAEEEARFGYIRPEGFNRKDQNALAHYQSRLVVPEPDRFYRGGAGKPLLPALLSIPQLTLLEIFSSGSELLHLQYNYNYHPLFILTRLVQLLAGLISIFIVHAITKREFGVEIAPAGAAVFAFFPLSVKYFPNIHYESILVPFLIGSSYLLLKGRYIMGGLIYGLALASKNTAIFIVPAFVVYYLWEGYVHYRQTNITEATTYLTEKVREIVIFGLLGMAVLIPFANPVSYIQEILTPITHREFDARGPDVDTFTLSSRLQPTSEDEGRSNFRSEVQFIRLSLGYNGVLFFFVALAFFLSLQTSKKPISKLSLIFLLMALPYGLVFGYGLGYRQLIFLPFFAILCADLLDKKYLKMFASILLLITLVYSIDPISTDTIHYVANDNNLFDSAYRWIAD